MCFVFKAFDLFSKIALRIFQFFLHECGQWGTSFQLDGFSEKFLILDYRDQVSKNVFLASLQNGDMVGPFLPAWLLKSYCPIFFNCINLDFNKCSSRETS